MTLFLLSRLDFFFRIISNQNNEIFRQNLYDLQQKTPVNSANPVCLTILIIWSSWVLHDEVALTFRYVLIVEYNRHSISDLRHFILSENMFFYKLIVSDEAKMP